MSKSIVYSLTVASFLTACNFMISPIFAVGKISDLHQIRQLVKSNDHSENKREILSCFLTLAQNYTEHTRPKNFDPETLQNQLNHCQDKDLDRFADYLVQQEEQAFFDGVIIAVALIYLKNQDEIHQYFRGDHRDRNFIRNLFRL